MQILRSDIYLLAFLFPFDVLLKCKNLELAIIIALGLLLMTPKESLALILSTSSTQTNSSLGSMQNADETKQLLLHHYAANNSSSNSSWNKQVSNNSNNNKSSPGGLIRCSSKLKCFDLNSALRMRNGGQLSGGKEDTAYYSSGGESVLYQDSNKVRKFSSTSRHLRLRRDHETNVIDTPSSIEQQQQQKPKLMKNITQERSQSNYIVNTQQHHRQQHGADDLIKLNFLEDLKINSNSNRSQGKETSVESSTHSSYNGFLKLIFFISIIFVILLIIIASIIYRIWVIRRFSTNLEQINRRLPEANHNLLNHSIQDFEALMLSVQNLGCAGMERLGSPPSNLATSCSSQREHRSIRRPTTIPIMQHDLKVSRQPQQSNNSSKAQQCCYNNFNSGINSQHHPSSDGNYHHRNNHQYTSCTSNNCPTHIQHPQHDGEFNRRIPSLDQCNDEIKRTYIQGPPNKTIQDVPDACNSHLPLYASQRYSSNIHNNNVNLCNNNLSKSNQKPSNNQQQPHNNHHNSNSSSSQCRNDKMRKTSSNFLLDKLKFLRANSSSTNVKSASVDYKTHSNVSATTPTTTICHQKSNPIMVHNTSSIPSSVVLTTTTTNSGMRCAISQQQQQSCAHPSTAQQQQTEDSTERNIMFNGSTNINFSPSSSANLKVSSSSSSSASLLSQTLSYSSDCHGDL